MSKRIIAGLGVVAGLAVALAPVATFADTVYPNAHQDKLSVTIEKVCTFGYTYADGTAVAIGVHTDGTAVSPATGTETLNSKVHGKSYGVWDIAESNSVKPATAYDVDPTQAEDVYDTATASTNGTTITTDTAYGIMENKTKNETFAKTKLNVVCNNIDGYDITAETTALTGSGLPAIAQTNSLDETSASSWSFKYAAVANEDDETAATTSNVRTLTYGSSTAGTWDNAMTKKSIITMAKASGSTGTENAATPKRGDSYEVTYGVAIDSVQPAGTYEGTITYVLAQTL